MVNDYEEIIKNEMALIVKAIESCVTGEQLMNAHNLIDNFKSTYKELNKKKKTKPIYSNIENFCDYQKTKIYLKMHNQLMESDNI